MRAHASLWAGNVAARANYSGQSWPQKPSVATQVLHCHDLIIDHMLPKAEAAWIVYPSGNIRSQASPRTSLWCVSYTHRIMCHCNCNCYCVLCTAHRWVLLMWCVTDGYSDTCTIQSLVYCNTKAFRWRIFPPMAICSQVFNLTVIHASHLHLGAVKSSKLLEFVCGCKCQSCRDSQVA